MRTLAIALLSAGLMGCVTMPEGMLPKASSPSADEKPARPSRRWTPDDVTDKNARKVSQELWDDLDHEETSPRLPTTK